ncbi:MAG TPA: helix-turn-helix domain-containing protein [Caulobacteraceae bacterium]|jgi:excisionase family DNA binding protein
MTAPPLTPLALRLADFTRVTGVSRSKAYEMIAAHELKAVMVGGRRLIPYAEAERLIREAA